jgi:FkbM family methyltransferase
MTNTLLLQFLRSEFVPLRLRKKVGKFVPCRRNVSFTVNCLGATYMGETGNHVDNKVYLYGRHESPTLRVIQTYLKRYKQYTGKPSTFVDVGVNSGLHMVCGAVCADHAYGFEPWDKMREVAQKNLHINKLDNARIFPFGLSDKDDVLPFLQPSTQNLGMGAFVRGDAMAQKAIQETTGVSMNEAIPLEVKNGDSILTEYNIAPTVIKIDTEGFEKFVLDGLKDSMKKSRPMVIFEYSDITKGYLPDAASLTAIFPENYQFLGVLRSREFPVLKPYDTTTKFENLIAVPTEYTELLNS